MRFVCASRLGASIDGRTPDRHDAPNKKNSTITDNKKKTPNVLNFINYTAECSLVSFKFDRTKDSKHKNLLVNFRTKTAENFEKSRRVRGDRRHFPMRRFGRD